MAKVAPIGTIREWQSGRVIKAFNPTLFSDGWMPIGELPSKLKSLTIELDELARDINKYKEPVEGGLWLDREISNFRTIKNKKYNPEDFKKYNGWYGATSYAFGNEFTRQYLEDKMALKEFVDDKLVEANKRLSSVKAGSEGKVILLTPEEIKEIKQKAKNEFKYLEDPLDLKDVENLKDVLKNVLGYLKQGEDFIGDKKKIYDEQVNIREHFTDEYERLTVKRSQMDDSLSKIDEAFQDNWGIRESYRKKFLDTWQKYVNKYRDRIEKDDLQDFKDKLGCELNAPKEEFYSKLKAITNIDEEQITDYIGKRIPSPFSKYDELILLDVVRNPFQEDNILLVKDPYTGKESRIPSSYIKSIEKKIAARKAVDIDLPMKIRFNELYSKSLQGSWSSEDITMLQNIENLADYLPLGHFVNNKMLSRFSKEEEFQTSNSYAHYNPRDLEIYFSNEAVTTADQSFNIQSGNEFNHVFTHELGHAVSKKLKSSHNIDYRKFAYECGWSWTQFEGHKGFQATGDAKDTPRQGPNSHIPLITEYAHKSPEEAFAEYYALYTQNRKDIDKFLDTGEIKYVEKTSSSKVDIADFLSGGPKTKYADEILSFRINESVNDSIKSALKGQHRSINEHIQSDYINPHTGFNSPFDSTQFTKKEHQNYIKNAEEFPNPVFSVVEKNGKHQIITATDHLSNRANRSYDGLTPTFSISSDAYVQLKSKNFSDEDIRGFVFAHFADKAIQIEQIGYKPKRNEETSIVSNKGLSMRYSLIPSSVIQRNKKPLEAMRKIWNSEELRKALGELYGVMNEENEQILEKEGFSLMNIFKSVKDTISNLVGKKSKPQDYGDTLVLNYKNEILLLRRLTDKDEFAAGQWCLPGGKIEEGETPLEGATRELQEETAIIAQVPLIAIAEKILDNGSTIYYHTLNVSPDQLIGLDNEEHFSYEWVSLDKLDEYDMIFDLKDCIREKLVPQIYLNPPISLEPENIFKSLFINSLIEKSNLNFEWRDRKTKNGKIFKQRFRVNHNKQESEDKEVELPSELRDKLFTSHLYNGNYYTKQGEKIKLSPEQKHSAFKVYDSKYNYANLEAQLFGTGDNEKEEFKKLIPIVHEKNEIFNEISEMKSKELIQQELEIKQFPEYAKDLVDQLMRVSSLFSSDIEPMLRVNIEGREIVEPLGDAIANFDNIRLQSLQNMIPITSLSIDNLEDFTAEDFVDYHDYDSIYSLVNSKLEDKVNQIHKAFDLVKEGFNSGLIDTKEYLKYTKTYKNFVKGQTGEQEDNISGVDEDDVDNQTQQSSEKDQEDTSEEGFEEPKSTTGHTDQQLREFAKKASLQDLQAVISGHGDEMLRKVAHEEMKRREEEEHVPEEKDLSPEEEAEQSSVFDDQEKVKQFIKDKKEHGDDASKNPFIKEMQDELNDYAQSPEHREVDELTKNITSDSDGEFDDTTSQENKDGDKKDNSKKPSKGEYTDNDIEGLKKEGNE